MRRDDASIEFLFLIEQFFGRQHSDRGDGAFCSASVGRRKSRSDGPVYAAKWLICRTLCKRIAYTRTQ